MAIPLSIDEKKINIRAIAIFKKGPFTAIAPPGYGMRDADHAGRAVHYATSLACYGMTLLSPKYKPLWISDTGTGLQIRASGS
ncbi:MAG: hypothetical protein U5J78_07490 [Parasphingorhabdus sp.]|nr:hypothetical protein [Parasphingorhabdus sp.]